MSIACDHPGCENRCHQPMPLGWDVMWTDEKWYEHLCPDHSGVKLPASMRQDKIVTKNEKPKSQRPPKPEDDNQGGLF